MGGGTVQRGINNKGTAGSRSQLTVLEGGKAMTTRAKEKPAEAAKRTARPTKENQVMIRLDDEQKRLYDEYVQKLVSENQAESGSAWVRQLILRIIREGWQVVPPERQRAAGA